MFKSDVCQLSQAIFVNVKQRLLSNFNNYGCRCLKAIVVDFVKTKTTKNKGCVVYVCLCMCTYIVISFMYFDNRQQSLSNIDKNNYTTSTRIVFKIRQTAINCSSNDFSIQAKSHQNELDLDLFATCLTHEIL
jgi:hypothetical protein